MAMRKMREEARECLRLFVVGQGLTLEAGPLGLEFRILQVLRIRNQLGGANGQLARMAGVLIGAQDGGGHTDAAQIVFGGAEQRVVNANRALPAAHGARELDRIVGEEASTVGRVLLDALGPVGFRGHGGHARGFGKLRELAVVAVGQALADGTP
jgi:hypothetical protein